MNRKERRAKGQAHKPAANRTPVEGLLAQAQDFLNRGLFNPAAEVYRTVLARAPANSTALFNLALICQQRESFAEAQACLHTYLKNTPDDPEALLALAFILMDAGRRHDALDVAAGVKTQGLSAPLLTKLGIFYREAGNFTEASAFFSKALTQKPDYIEAHYSRRTLKKLTADDPDFTVLEQLAQNPSHLGVEDKVRLEFTLAKALDDQGKTNDAFAHYARANALKRATYKYDMNSFEKHVDKTIHHFDQDRVNHLYHPECAQSQRPVFVVGMPRSGSTLIDQILTSHPSFASIGESKALPLCLPGQDAQLTSGSIKALGEAYLTRTDDRAGNSARLIDKMLFNFLRIGLIATALPKARIIWCTRDPLDIGLSIWQLLFTEKLPWAYDLGEIGRYFHVHQRLMRHWQRIFPGRIYEANYETLVMHQEQETKRLLDFCDLDFDERCLHFHETQRPIKTASAGQVRQPVYNSSIGKGKRHEQYLAPLLTALAQA